MRMNEIIRCGDVDSLRKNCIPSLLQTVAYGVWKPFRILRSRESVWKAGAQCFGRLLSLLNPE